MQAFDRFVEIGRVVLLQDGPLSGKLAVVLDVVDLNRILIQSPEVPRQVFAIRRVSLTEFTMPLPRGARTKTLLKCWNESNVDAKWSETPMAKNLARMAIRKNLTDFERFKVMLARKKRDYILRA